MKPPAVARALVRLISNPEDRAALIQLTTGPVGGCLVASPLTGGFWRLALFFGGWVTKQMCVKGRWS